MKILKINLNGFPHPNSLMPPTWYPISTSHIPTSSVHFLCPDHTVALVSYLCAFSNRNSFINFLVYLICLFSLNSSFYALFEVSFQTFRLLFSFLFLIFLLTQYSHNRKQNKIQNNIETILAKSRWWSSLLYLLLTFSGTILKFLISIFFILILFSITL